MSHICLQFGQCGNQVGSQIYSLIYEDLVSCSGESYTNIGLDSWFNIQENILQARAVLIDTEDKVVKNISSKCNWSYNSEAIVNNNCGGSANNWAFGYNVKGPQMLNSAVEALRKECEKCDRLQGFITISSSAGGSGSGLCSYFTQDIQNEFSDKNVIISVLVLPYVGGEIVNQNYNSLFSLSHLYKSSDAIIIFQNDVMHNLLTSQDTKSDGFTNLNNLIAKDLGSVLQPVSENGLMKRFSFPDFSSHLCAHPSYKLLTIKTLQHNTQANDFQSNLKWNSIQDCELDMCSTKSHFAGQKYNSRGSINCKVVGNIVISRGELCIPTVDSKPYMSSASMYPRWFSNYFPAKFYSQPRRYLKSEQFVTLVTNNSNIQFNLDHILKSAWISFTNNSYTYLYEKYGVMKEDFMEAFFNIEGVNQAYASL